MGDAKGTGEGIRIIETPSLGDRSYIVDDGDVAVVVDPQRDIERVMAVVEEAGLRLTHVLETHIHNDYVTGGLALAREVGAVYGIPDGETMAFDDHVLLGDGAEVRTGSLRLSAVHTPGHTPTHIAFVASRDDDVLGILSGGSLLYGAVGRTDLISPDLARPLAVKQYGSVHRLAELVADDVPVLPTHGFGSHCSSGTADVFRSGTVGEERHRNPALLESDAEVFADLLVAGYGPFPRYYARMDPANRGGPDAVPDTLPARLDAGGIDTHLQKGAMVVDLRTRMAYAASHIPGTVSVELRNDLPTYLGWVYDADDPLVLLAPNESDAREAQVMLARIGLDDLAGVGIGDVADLAGDLGTTSYGRAMWPEVNDQRPDDAVVLDVRDSHEFSTGHHSAAIHIPFHDVLARGDEIPEGPVWVYCATGNRASVAASLLEREGREVVLIDDFCLPGDVPG